MLLADFFLTCPWQTLKKEPVKRSIGEHVTEASVRERAGRARTRADSHARSAISKEKLEGLNRLVQKDTLKTIPWSATHTRLGPIMDFLSAYLQMLQFFLMRGRVGGTQYRNAVRKIGKYANFVSKIDEIPILHLWSVTLTLTLYPSRVFF